MNLYTRLAPWLILRRHRQRRSDLSVRVRVAKWERRVSRRRLEHARANVIRPLEEAGRRNHFADIIRHSLQEGHGR